MTYTTANDTPPPTAEAMMDMMKRVVRDSPYFPNMVVTTTAMAESTERLFPESR